MSQVSTIDIKGENLNVRAKTRPSANQTKILFLDRIKIELEDKKVKTIARDFNLRGGSNLARKKT